MWDSSEKAVFDLGTYLFEGREYRLLYSWPMLYAQGGPEAGDILSAPTEGAAPPAGVAGSPGERPPLAEAYARAVAQGYILQARPTK